MTNLQGDHDDESRHNGYPLIEDSIVTTVAQTTVEDGGVVVEDANTKVQTRDDDCGVRVALDGTTLWFEVGTRGPEFDTQDYGQRRAYARGNMTPEDARMIAAALEEAAEKVEQRKEEPPVWEQEQETEPTPQSAWDVERIQDHWHPNQVRLPPYLQRRFDGYFGRVEWLLTQANSDHEFKKDRHYKPLVVALGLQQLQTMDATEIETALNDLEQNQLVE